MLKFLDCAFFRSCAALTLLLFGGMITFPGYTKAADGLHAASFNSNSFGSADDIRRATATRLFELSRLDAFTRNNTSSIQEILTDLIADQQDETFRDVIFDAFRQEILEEVLKQSLTRSLREPAATETIAHLREPEIQALMQQLHDNDTDFSDPDTAEAFEAYLLETELHPEKFETRISLLSEILRVSQTARLTVQTLEDFLTIIIFALNQANPEEQRLSDREVNELIVSLRSNFRQLFDNVLLSVALFATRDTDEEVLGRHLRFLTSGSGSWYIRTYNSAVLNGFGEISEQVAAGLAAWAIEQAEEPDALED
ncbi:hypothetical protein CYPRO_3160 [Cyclonatronum proteinivorum]|uniref:DUF2059 domain-containing protein n=1 Tax=Cyclonatronum proteinivorum TaxID=1457365 RepID=A0A345UPJ2_9BACT|nr:hypothetical protein [Cyclonatronum proteinivorum]AXJ02394.1 hypothetical protein CYPRO_3160 [Cyclonatronum proteinivorum]